MYPKLEEWEVTNYKFQMHFLKYHSNLAHHSSSPQGPSNPSQESNSKDQQAHRLLKSRRDELDFK